LNQPARSPREEYTARLELAREVEAREERRAARLADARLFVFVLALGVAAGAFWLGWFSAWWMLIPVTAFAALLVVHDRVAKARDRAHEVIALQERGLARVEDRWSGTGRDGARFLDATHPYAADLDLFGPGSVFQRISTARTSAGERRLAAFLLAAAEPATIRDRQEAFEDLSRAGGDIGEGLDTDALANWAVATEAVAVGPARAIGVGFSVVTSLALLGLLLFDLDARLVLVAIALEFGFAWYMAKHVRRILDEADHRAEALEAIAAMLARIEHERFQSHLLSAIRDRLVVDGHAASSRISAASRLLDRLEWGRNMVFVPFALLFLWSTQVALSVELWRRRHGPRVRAWIDAVAEFEALASFAAYTFENPDHPFPEVAEDGEPIVEAKGLGHPLLPKASCVRNDLRLGGEVRVLVVSGSNMSGKSTLLRALGVNVGLALAGAPVNCGSLRLSPLAIGATLRVQDSLQTGTSRFYAEILRIRQVVDLTRGGLPLLFLLDEVLAGTNSHDRLSGATAVVRGLIDRGAIGLVTTHDLALAEVADGLAPRAANVHFEDQFADGVMRFDYLMRPGVVRKSNALELMRAVGLDV
jgi:MutS domain V